MKTEPRQYYTDAERKIIIDRYRIDGQAKARLIFGK